MKKNKMVAIILTIISFIFSLINIIPNMFVFLDYTFDPFSESFSAWVLDTDYLFFNFYILTLPALLIGLISIIANIHAFSKRKEKEKLQGVLLFSSLILTLTVFLLAKNFIECAW